MRRRPNNAATEFLLVLGALLALPLGASAGQKPLSLPTPCGYVKKVGGDVQLLNAARTKLLQTVVGSAIPCGGWATTGQGWMIVGLRDGHQLNIGSQTFVSFPDSTKPTETGDPADHLIVYRGQVYAEVGSGAGELRMITANARARISHGKAILIYADGEQESQLVTLESQASLENRFEPSEKTVVHAGEVSSLAMSLLRVSPEIPSAVSVASLKQRLNDLRLDSRTKAIAVRNVVNREERKFASNLEAEGQGSGSRAPASAGKRWKRRPLSSYARNLHGKNDAYLHAHWVRKMAGGENVGEAILYPDEYYGAGQKVRVTVEDPAAKLDRKQRRAEDREKRKLIEELSKIRVE